MTGRLLSLTFCLFLSPFLVAEDVPLPEKLFQAKTVYLIDESGEEAIFERMREEFFKWRRFEVLTSAEGADLLVFLKIGRTPAVVGGIYGRGAGTIVYDNDLLQLNIVDPKDRITLWTEVQDGWYADKGLASRLVRSLKRQLDSQSKKR